MRKFPTLDNYKILDTLGEGGHAIVKLAEDVETK